ncbi:hypothetical protein [Chelativorans sp. J32]|uniref:hypothetical protein n=1 Tax=Chelativorans sp. J32 TaxID=935840 RepID=UPI0004850679|nr:hypothetical protein [Chelativorans sp. J32]
MWQRVKDFFKDSETIAWARIQAVLGLLALLLTYVEPTLIAPLLGDYAPWFLFLNGLATEYLRRRRADDL